MGWAYWLFPCAAGSLSVLSTPRLQPGLEPWSRRSFAPRASATDRGEFITEDGGVRKLMLRPAATDATTPAWHAFVEITFTCAFSNGTLFDQSFREKPFEFQLTSGDAVDGLRKGVASMSVGERARITCEPDWAFGSAGVGDVVPPESTVVYEVELLGWRDGPRRVDSDEFDLETYRASMEGRAVEEGKADAFFWDERGEELMLQIPLDPAQGSREISCDFKPWSLSVEIAPDGPTFSGQLRGKVRLSPPSPPTPPPPLSRKNPTLTPTLGKVRADDSYWMIDDEGGERVLQIILAKAGSFSRWGGIFAEEDK